MEAAEEGHLSTVQLLLHGGADPHLVDEEGRGLLHYAARNDCKDVAQLLLDVGAKPNKTNNYGESPIQIAAKNGNTKVVQLLLADQGILNLHGKIFLETCNEDVVTTSNHTADTDIPDVNRVQK